MKLLESPESGKQLKACHSESEPGIANATPDNRKHRLLNYEEQGGVLCATFTIDYNLHPYCVAWICNVGLRSLSGAETPDFNYENYLLNIFLKSEMFPR